MKHLIKLKAIALICMITIISTGCSSKNASTQMNIKSESDDMLNNVKVSNSKQAEKYMKMLESYDGKNIFDVDGKYIDLNIYGGDAGQWIQTMEESTTIYIGALKDGKPEGKGIIFDRYYNRGHQYWIPKYVGEFSKGKLNGYGIEISNMTANREGEEEGILINFICREGEFTKGRLNGKVMFQSKNDAYGTWTDNVSSHYEGIKRYIDMSNPEIIEDERTSSIITNMLEKLEQREQDDTILVADFYPYTLPIYYIGEAKKNYCSGMGSFYYNRNLVYTGGFKEGMFDKNGILYNESSQKIYEGEFSKGEYNGQGTLYNADGSVKYSGKWKNGQVK